MSSLAIVCVCTTPSLAIHSNTHTHSLSLSHTVESTILQSPKDALAVEAEVVEFNCTASGIPSPTITWMISPPSGGSPAFTTTTTPVAGSETRVVGLLLLEATPVLNLTTVRCVAANGEGEAATSSSATLTVAGTMQCLSVCELQLSRTTLYCTYLCPSVHRHTYCSGACCSQPCSMLSHNPVGRVLQSHSHHPILRDNYTGRSHSV